MKTSVLKNIWRVGVVLLVNLLVIAVAFYFAGGPDAIETLSRYGSTGEEVRQIQTKLNELGYDTGGIDGTYGTKTKNAVIAFQKSQGLSADEMCIRDSIYSECKLLQNHENTKRGYPYGYPLL